jgi:uncharacterized protein (TIGR03032 family)
MLSTNIPIVSAATNELKEIRFRYSRNFPSILRQLQSSLLVSTYQAGKLAIIGVRDDKLNLSFHNFERPMGVAASWRWIAVGARSQIWFLRSAADIAPKLEPVGQYDTCFLARHSHVTGEIQCHEIAFAGDELWVANTLFSCLCTLDQNYNFVPRWQPKFISALAAEDRCHLNGLAIADGRPRYVTALAETDEREGWRANKAESGCLIDVVSGETITRGFAMPHSPRVHGGVLWLVDSGRGQLVRVDPAGGQRNVVAELPGYARGLAIHGNLAFVGLSKIRETAIFGGVPIAEKSDELRCGVAVVELRTGTTVATFEFASGVEEIFAVTALPGVTSPAMRGPFAAEDGQHAIWVVPQPGQQSDGFTSTTARGDTLPDVAANSESRGAI